MFCSLRLFSCGCFCPPFGQNLRWWSHTVSNIYQFEDDHFHDECGVFGIFGREEAAKLSYLGLYALQHRGQESAGIASTDGTTLEFYKSMGLVQEIFTPEVLARLPGN